MCMGSGSPDFTYECVSPKRPNPNGRLIIDATEPKIGALQCFVEQCSSLLPYPASLQCLQSPILLLLSVVTVHRCLHRAEFSGS
jgi:hypothetical protein